MWLAKMDFQQYLQKAFPELSVRKRTEFSGFHNFVKYLAIRFGYVLFKLKISGNLLDVISLILAVIGFYFLSLSMVGEKILPTVGVLIIFFHIWVDFIDGLLAKANDESSEIGHQFDNLGCDADRFMLIVLFGIFTGNHFLIISNVFVSYVLVVFQAQTRAEILKLNRIIKLKYLFSHKLSPLGVRFMLGILPLIILVFVFTETPINIFATFLTFVYSLFALIWLIICIPAYNK